MAWSPPGEAEAHNPAVDPFRERVGILQGVGPEDGAFVVLHAETHWSRTRGHLWWSRWSAPHEVMHVHLHLRDGDASDWLIAGTDLDEAVAAWLDGTFRTGGAAYSVVWQDDEQSARIRDDLTRGAM